LTGVPHRVGVYLALLQLIFTLCWVVYAIYLPRLAAQVGLPAGAVIFLLMLDQAIFTIFDVATGVAADKVSRMIGRLGRLVAAATIISCAAFLALPFVTAGGPAALPLFMALTVIWAVTSSALRAPPIMLLGKYAATPSLPYLSSLAMLGFGLAGAVAPYLALTLREVDPRLPFAAASAALVLTTLGLVHVERILAQQPAQPAEARTSAQAGRIAVRPLIFAAAMVVLALGYQLHFAINTGPLFRRFTDSIDHLIPVFWVGFNIAMFPATLLVKRWGGFTVMGLFGVVGALAILAAEFAGALDMLVVAQFAAGASWGCILMSAFTAAFAAAKNGTEGRMVGLLFSALALATLLRMAATAAGLHREWIAMLQWAPIICWAIAGATLLYLAAARVRRWAAA
jgi:hypothetical protein